MTLDRANIYGSLWLRFYFISQVLYVGSDKFRTSSITGGSPKHLEAAAGWRRPDQHWSSSDREGQIGH